MKSFWNNEDTEACQFQVALKLVTRDKVEVLWWQASRRLMNIVRLV